MESVKSLSSLAKRFLASCVGYACARSISRSKPRWWWSDARPRDSSAPLRHGYWSWHEIIHQLAEGFDRVPSQKGRAPDWNKPKRDSRFPPRLFLLWTKKGQSLQGQPPQGSSFDARFPYIAAQSTNQLPPFLFFSLFLSFFCPFLFAFSFSLPTHGHTNNGGASWKNSRAVSVADGGLDIHTTHSPTGGHRRRRRRREKKKSFTYTQTAVVLQSLLRPPTRSTRSYSAQCLSVRARVCVCVCLLRAPFHPHLAISLFVLFSYFFFTFFSSNSRHEKKWIRRSCLFSWTNSVLYWIKCGRVSNCKQVRPSITRQLSVAARHSTREGKKCPIVRG